MFSQCELGSAAIEGPVRCGHNGSVNDGPVGGRIAYNRWSDGGATARSSLNGCIRAVPLPPPLTPRASHAICDGISINHMRHCSVIAAVVALNAVSRLVTCSWCLQQRQWHKNTWTGASKQLYIAGFSLGTWKGGTGKCGNERTSPLPPPTIGPFIFQFPHVQIYTFGGDAKFSNYHCHLHLFYPYRNITIDDVSYYIMHRIFNTKL